MSDSDYGAQVAAKSSIYDMSKLDPALRPTAAQLAPRFPCACNISPLSSRGTSLSSKHAPHRHDLDSMARRQNSNIVPKHSATSADSWSKNKSGSHRNMSRYSYTPAWDLPMWEDAEALSVASYFYSFYSDGVNGGTFFPRSSKTCLLSTSPMDFWHVKDKEHEQVMYFPTGTKCRRKLTELVVWNH